MPLGESQTSRLLTDPPVRKKMLFDSDDATLLTCASSDLDSAFQEMLTCAPEETCYFLNERALRTQKQLFDSHFLPDYPSRHIAYAVKANPRRRILQILSEEGMDYFDCASINEISRVQAVQPRATNLYNHPIKRSCDIKQALKQGVDTFTVQSREEVKKIFDSAALGQPLNIMLRLSTLNAAAGIDLSTKYGADIHTAQQLLVYLRASSREHLRTSVSVNTGSQNSDANSFIEGMKYIRYFADAHEVFDTVNLGGGIPVSYASNDDYSTIQYLDTITAGVQDILSDHLVADSHIVIEPGRSLVAPVVDLTIPVLAKEERGGKPCIYAHDGIFTSFTDHVVHGWPYYFRVLDHHGRERTGATVSHTFFGHTCDSGDVMHEVPLPSDVQAGDYLWLQNAGAYMDSQATRFNGLEPAKYISFNS